MILSSTIKRQGTARDILVPWAQVTGRLSTALSFTLAVRHNTTHAMDPHIAVPAPSGMLSLKHGTRTRYAMFLQCPSHLPFTNCGQIRYSPGIRSSTTTVHKTTTTLKMAIDIAMPVRMGGRPCRILSRSHPESIAPFQVPSPPCTGRAHLAPAVACTSSLQRRRVSRFRP
jgi:hypothetical protein